MLRKILYGLVFFMCMPLLAQEDRIAISEKKSGKRVVIYAENTTNDTLNVFFLVHAEGYRRSASKPILKNVAPKSKVPLTTLIELADVPSSYTYELIVNQGEQPVALDYENEAPDIESVLHGKLVIFTIPNCEKCSALTTQLLSTRTPHKEFNINEDPVLYRQFMSFIEGSLTTETRIKFPVIWNKSYTLFGYEDLDTLISELKSGGD